MSPRELTSWQGQHTPVRISNYFFSFYWSWLIYSLGPTHTEWRLVHLVSSWLRSLLNYSCCLVHHLWAFCMKDVIDTSEKGVLYNTTFFLERISSATWENTACQADGWSIFHALRVFFQLFSRLWSGSFSRSTESQWMAGPTDLAA